MQTIKGFKAREDHWDGVFMLMAISAGNMSHCTRHQVGCVIVKDRRPLAMGINGSPSGQPNCDEVFPNPPPIGSTDYDEYFDAHGKWSTDNEQHAESNAIAWAARYGLSLDGATAYLTLSPCIACAKQLVAAGIERVVYLEEYDRCTKGIEFINKAGIDIEQIRSRFVQLNIDRASMKLD